ncbi:MAG: phage major tail protein, TP901-1 family [Alphaproteobacteria bacterium]|nr:phage major tail protein, TP901-1 family [Alphaproteobacteria bacterium]
MAGQRGRDMLVKVGDGGSPETFVVVAGLRTQSITLGARVLDATTTQSPGAWRELMACAGVKSVEIAGSGLFKDAASDTRMRTAFFAGEPVKLQLVLPDFGTLTGPFVISALAYSGDHDGEEAFAIRLPSAGLVGFEAD